VLQHRLRTYQAQVVPALADLGVGLFAISRRHPTAHLPTRETKAPTFTVLSDPGSEVVRQIGILPAAGL
jgi:peroxiredoxin